jgi:hypothetical protein
MLRKIVELINRNIPGAQQLQRGVRSTRNSLASRHCNIQMSGR